MHIFQNCLLMQQAGTDLDTRKRRACRDADEDSILSEEEDRLAGLLHVDEGDSDDGGLDEHTRRQLHNAHVLKGSNVSQLPS